MFAPIALGHFCPQLSLFTHRKRDASDESRGTPDLRSQRRDTKRTKVVNDKRPNDVQPLFLLFAHTCQGSPWTRALEWKCSRFYCHSETGSTRHNGGRPLSLGLCRQLLCHKWGASSRWRDYHIRAHIGCGEHPLSCVGNSSVLLLPVPAPGAAPALAPARVPAAESETRRLTGSVCQLYSGFLKQHVLLSWEMSKQDNSRHPLEAVAKRDKFWCLRV